MRDKQATFDPDAAGADELYKEWRLPRDGRANPERMNNPVWEWLIRSGLSAYSASAQFGLESSCESGPSWCFDRNGQSSTELEDGRQVLIAGEHEDFYDADFFIYNDVVVQSPCGQLDIYGYPKNVFPPTDFHSATLVGDRLFIIGSLGYKGNRKPGLTQAYVLYTGDFKIGMLECSGTSPGWLHRHQAQFIGSENSILITGGMIGTGNELLENIDDWKLHLDSAHWERLTNRRWPRWNLFLKDKEKHFVLFQLKTLQMWKNVDKKRYQKELSEVKAQLGFEPNLKLLAELYSPPIAHRKIHATEDECNIYRIEVNGVTVRYNEELHGLRITVEGELPITTAEILARDLQRKISRLQQQPYELVRLQ